MMKLVAIGFLFLQLHLCVFAADFAKLDEALPIGMDILEIAPIFDFDGDACLPAAAVSRSGEKNGGQKTSGSVTGACRSSNFLDLSNTYHRGTCVESGGSNYCGHIFGLYFEKDQVSGWGGGHRHDWEHAIIFTVNGFLTDGCYSAHGSYTCKWEYLLDKQDKHIKFVYHKEGAGSHAMRFSKDNEVAENPYRAFVTPTIVSWFTMVGDGVSNWQMIDNFYNYDYGSAQIDLKDYRFFNILNENLPPNFPTF